MNYRINRIMKRFLAILTLSLLVLPAIAQEVYVRKGYPDNNIPSFSYFVVNDDPVADFIKTYAPNYFFQEMEVAERSDIYMTIRTLYNFDDPKSLSQIILATRAGEVLREKSLIKTDDYYIWESIDADEVDGILSFLSSVAPLKVRYDDPMTRVYNTKHGLLLMGRDDKIYMKFPDSGVVKEISANRWIPLFEKARDMIADAMKGKEPFIVGASSNDEFGSTFQESSLGGTANAYVKGRNVLGSLPKPTHNAKLEGTVVVQIKVDQYGNVTEAIAGAEGTTVTDKTLWTAARNAALKAHFNMDASAPAVQSGTITYIFKKNE